MSLKIGPIHLDDPVILAPMAGVTDAPFRRLAHRFGAGLTVSEMIASKAMVRAHTKTLRMSSSLETAHPQAVQIVGCEPDVMADAARMNADRGAGIIDINMGCPAKKIIRGEAGAALMKDEVLAGRIMESVVRSVAIPVTVKMRLGWDEGSINAPRLAKIAEESGVALVTVHGRTRSQFYGGQADWDRIGEVKRSVSIPVVANGDVTTLDRARAILDQSGADGVMIGRASYGRPWFLGLVAHFLKTGERLPEPSPLERLAILQEHVEDMLDHYGEKAGVPIARKHIAWYSRGLPGSAEFRSHLMRLSDPNEVRTRLLDFWKAAQDRMAA
ncbi:MAG: tRNA dihydrouridine synthase DusB [Alphaproteobacteria bacterium]|nr:tRNA dihydrouridine synthase DusB [Alphaproteobacteria bacterium]